MIDLYDEFRTLVAALERQSIDYALCGGIAMGSSWRAASNN